MPVISPAESAPAPDGSDPALVMREALAEFLLALDPVTARKIAVSCLRLAAAAVAIAAEAEGPAGARGAAGELLLLLAEGLPELPAVA